MILDLKHQFLSSFIYVLTSTITWFSLGIIPHKFQGDGVSPIDKKPTYTIKYIN